MFGSLVSLLTNREERIIRRAARAERAYWQMLATSDDQRRRMAMMQRRMELDAELRGDTKPLPPADLSTSLEVAVNRELLALKPAVETQLILQRKARRLASSCGPTQLTLSATGEVRRKLRAMVHASQLSPREIASALGLADRTIERHMQVGHKMSRERRSWYDRLESIDVDGSMIHIVVRRVAPTRKRWGWDLTRDERAALLRGDGRASDDRESTQAVS